MQWYEEEVRMLEQRQRETPAPSGRVVFYGSSSMRLWESLGNDLPEIGLVNVAFGGSTLEACAHFFERLVVPCAPRSIICYAGDNDLGDGQPPEAVVTSFRRLFAKVDEHLAGTRFTFLSIKPSPSRWHIADRIRRTNELIRSEIAGRPDRFFIDVFTPMLRPDGHPEPAYFLEDGLHVSPRGYLLWRDILTRFGPSIF